MYCCLILHTSMDSFLPCVFNLFYIFHMYLLAALSIKHSTMCLCVVLLEALCELGTPPHSSFFTLLSLIPFYPPTHYTQQVRVSTAPQSGWLSTAIMQSLQQCGLWASCSMICFWEMYHLRRRQRLWLATSPSILRSHQVGEPACYQQPALAVVTFAVGKLWAVQISGSKLATSMCTCLVAWMNIVS